MLATRRREYLTTSLLGLMVLLFTVALVVYPKQGFDAGFAGMKMFWTIVFPSLLPFFILSEFLLGLGVVRGFGVLLEPLMRPLFGVPGVGAFALSMGLAAGYPMDAVITARFREQKLCSRIEGERLLAFTNTADPLFMFGAVAVGMFKSPEIGALLAIAHYISAFLVGVLFKLWGRRADKEDRLQPALPAGSQQESTSTAQVSASKRRNLFARAFTEMVAGRAEDNRPFGRLMHDAVTESIQTLLMICGFIVFFAVLIEVLRLSGAMAVIGWPIAAAYRVFGIHGGLVSPTLAGLLEIDIGSAQTAAAAAPLIQKLALVSGIIAWSGLSVHAQVASVLTQTDIRMRPYFIARFLHAALAAALTVFFYRLGMGHAAAAVATAVPLYGSIQMAVGHASLWAVMEHSLWLWGACFSLLLAVALTVWAVRWTRIHVTQT